MSLILFPQERNTDNLTHVILPLGIALAATANFNPGLVIQEWITASVFMASIGALFLYMFSIDDIIVRGILRKRTIKKYEEKLGNSFSIWSKETFEEAYKKQLVDNMVSNAVSSHAIRRRTVRIRALGYFLVAYFFYVDAGCIYFIRLLEASDLLTNVLWIGLVLAAFGWLVLCYCLFKRRAFGSHILRDVAYVAEFIFAMWMDKKHLHTHQEDLSYMDTLLTRQDMDSFAIMWGNTLSKMGS